MSGLHGLKAATIVVSLATAGLVDRAWSAEPSAGEPPTERAGAATRDLSLRAALKALQDQGLNVVFSSALIQPQLRADPAVPPGDSLPARARALLKPHGLGLEQVGSDVWYVVRLPAQPLAPPIDEAVVAAPEPSAGILEEVLVSSSREQPGSNRPGYQRVERDDLAITPSLGRDLLRALNHMPGQSSVGISARSHMRGGDTNEVLYLIDGVEIIEPFHMGDFHALFSAINPGLVEAVNVYNAGFPAAFGSRLSAVIDMELAEPEEPVEGRVNVDFISAATHAQGTVEDSRWLVSARRSTVDYLLEYLEQDYGRPTFHDGLARVAWQDESSDVSVGMLYGGDELVLEDNSAGESAFADYDNAQAWIRGSRTLPSGLELRVAGSFTSVENERWGSLRDPANAVGHLRESRDFRVYSLRTGLRWQPEDAWSIDAGLEGQRQSGEFEADVNSRYGALAEPLQPVEHLQRSVRSDREGTLLTAYVSSQRRLTPAWSVELGARYDLQDIDPLQDHQFSPRLQLTYVGPSGWRAFINAGRYAQHQNLYELQLDDGLLELHAPQIADQLSVGADWSYRAWRLGAEAYWREIDNPWSRFENLYNRWVLLPELHADRVALAPDQARTFGTELTLEHRPRQRLAWSVTWSLARARERFSQDWRPRPWEQRRTLRGSLDWRPGHWQVGLRAAYHSGWPTTSLRSGPAIGFEDLHDARFPDYFSLDLQAVRRIELPRSAVELYFSLSNVTFADNVGGYRYEAEQGRLVADERRLLPAVPMLGLSWFW